MGHYEKVHIAYNRMEEGEVYSQGEGFRTLNICVMICFDGRFPASALCLSHMGAEVILHPHANYSHVDFGMDPIDWTEKNLPILVLLLQTIVSTPLCVIP